MGIVTNSKNKKIKKHFKKVYLKQLIILKKYTILIIAHRLSTIVKLVRVKNKGDE